MLFTVKNTQYMSAEQLRTTTLLKAYHIIQKYKLAASDTAMDNYLQQQYKIKLRDLCVKLLLDLTFYTDDSGDLILLFKDKKSDWLAQLITYGNGAIPGSRILKLALVN